MVVVKLPLISWFMVMMFTGGKGCRLGGPLRTSIVMDLEFKMSSTSVIIVNKDSSSKHSTCVFKIYPRMALAERIWLTHMTCQRRVLVSYNPLTTLFLQERLNFPAIHLHIHAFFNSHSAPMNLL